MEELEEVVLFIYWPEKKVYIVSGLTPVQKRKIIKFLQDNLDWFTWSLIDMEGISVDIMVYKLNVDQNH